MIEWKKVSEHPLPEGDKYNLLFLDKMFHIWQGKIYTKNNHPDLEVTHWAEINLPEEDKKPEIELWTVWQGGFDELYILIEAGSTSCSLWNTRQHNIVNFTIREVLDGFKPRPDLEVLAPSICRAGHGYYTPGSINGVLFYNKQEGSNHYKWPSSLSAMIVVPKGGV